MSDISWDQSIRSFIGQAGSADPTPGGGSVAAVVAALGAAMTSMVGRLSQGDKFTAIRPQIEETLAEMTRLSAECETLMHADIASFGQYLSALRLPKATEDEKAQRRAALRDAAVQATAVPLRLMAQCREGLTYTLRIAEGANKNVLSDLAIASILLEAAARSALLTAEINFGALGVPPLAAAYAEQANEEMRRIADMAGGSAGHRPPQDARIAGSRARS
ncbi:cyclodeaminase/cyclohydrolase family protein [Cohnella ginsengisoli]|uniref:Cyclodeaminase/cyclohydrolase family protein n=1 Tax=Cohnella ginsengisoli TaxID=425004 RepID=A0A9X4KHU9_9BACL|nr:cyclodeaminase/cyclohydrolase family protein [Cohnella ginsengisoli]MDG0792091.1 cyclodeaminase/cyclohydrolase family protein [Cohnella ginsengisoli]